MRVFADDAAGKFVQSVTLNGCDVTATCIAADNEEGWVDLLLINTKGEVVRNQDGGVQVVHVTGRVEIVYRRWCCPTCGQEFSRPQQLLLHLAAKPHAHPN